MITRAKLKLVGKLATFVGFMVVQTKICGWIGRQFGEWIVASVQEVKDA